MKLSDASIPSLLLEETADASISTPAANKIRLFLDDDGILKWKDETGTVYEVGGTGGGDIATDAIWDTKGDLAVATGADTASKLAAGADDAVLTVDSGEATGLKWATPASSASALLYDYTVVGSDKTSIDTGVDTPDDGIAGTSAFAGTYRLLEIMVYARTDEAATQSGLAFLFNNDSGANYDRQYATSANATGTEGTAVGQNSMSGLATGSSATASYFCTTEIIVHNYGATVAYKTALKYNAYADSTGANSRLDHDGFTWRNTGAITRFSVAPTTALKKLKVGSRLTIIAR